MKQPARHKRRLLKPRHSCEQVISKHLEGLEPSIPDYKTGALPVTPKMRSSSFRGVRLGNVAFVHTNVVELNFTLTRVA
jgi:hypothetical protein